MTAQNTIAKAFHFNPLASLRDGAVRLLKFLTESSSVMACAREAERLMELSDEDLAARGLTRDRIVHHAFRRYVTF